MPPLLPPHPADVTNALERRIRVLEDSMRRPGLGGYSAIVTNTSFLSTPQTWADPGVSGDPGPEVVGTVPPSGRVWVCVSADAGIQYYPATPLHLGQPPQTMFSVGVRLSGANTDAGDTRRAANIYLQNNPGVGILTRHTICASVLFENLTPGPTTFRMVFNSMDITGSNAANENKFVSNRTLIVVPL